MKMKLKLIQLTNSFFQYFKITIQFITSFITEVNGSQEMRKEIWKKI